jgi:hypothetical protein
LSPALHACPRFHLPKAEKGKTVALTRPSLRSSPNLIRRYGGQNGGTGAAEHFASKAMNIINTNLDTPSLAEIQALCLIIIHEWGSRNAVRAYIYLGQAARMVQMYHILHSHHSQQEADRFLPDESFRRVVWLLYILDSMLTSTPGRQPALSSHDTMDLPLPCSDMNYAFGNAVYVKTLAMTDPSRMPPGAQTDVIGEFGHIVLATRIWRESVQMLMTSTAEVYDENLCAVLLNDVERLRSSLPMQYVDKAGQINLHITMGSGFTYAMIHCLLHCAGIFINRRRLLQTVTMPDFNVEVWRNSPQRHELVDHLFTSCHSTIAMLNALEVGSDKDSILCFPIFMLFASFTASSTAAYLSLKGLSPPNTEETAAHIVTDGLRFMQEGVDTWPLIGSWLRHLTVMHRVLQNESLAANPALESSSGHGHTVPVIVKEEAASNPDTNPDPMDYDAHSNSNVQGHGHQGRASSVAGSARGDSEPPIPPVRRTGITTINGGSGGISTPATASPPPAQDRKPTPEMPAAPAGNGIAAAADQAAAQTQDMTAAELCTAFERQLLELDDLAAFMGGGV